MLHLTRGRRISVWLLPLFILNETANLISPVRTRSSEVPRRELFTSLIVTRDANFSTNSQHSEAFVITHAGWSDYKDNLRVLGPQVAHAAPLEKLTG